MHRTIDEVLNKSMIPRYAIVGFLSGFCDSLKGDLVFILVDQFGPTLTSVLLCKPCDEFVPDTSIGTVVAFTANHVFIGGNPLPKKRDWCQKQVSVIR